VNLTFGVLVRSSTSFREKAETASVPKHRHLLVSFGWVPRRFLGHRPGTSQPAFTAGRSFHLARPGTRRGRKGADVGPTPTHGKLERWWTATLHWLDLLRWPTARFRCSSAL